MNNLFKFGVGGALFLLPFLVNPFTYSFDLMLHPPKLMALFLLGSFLFSSYLWRTHASLGVGFFSFAILCVATGFGGIQLYPLLYTLCSLFIALWFVEQPKSHQEFYLRCLTVSGSVLSIYAFVQMADLDPIFNYAPGVERTHPIAFMGQATKFGAYIAMIAVVALAIRDWTSFVLCSAAAVGTNSSFTLAALAVGFYINMRWIFRGKKKLLYLPILSVVVVFIAYLFNKDAVFLLDNGRFDAWKETYKAIINGPLLTGYGPGSFQILFPKHFQKEGLEYGYFIQAHNDYLQAFFEGGLIAVFSIGFIYFSVAKQYFHCWWKTIKLDITERAALSGFAAISVNALGNFPFQLAPHFTIAIIFLIVILRMETHGSKLSFHP
jgi:hypothetical protein